MSTTTVSGGGLSISAGASSTLAIVTMGDGAETSVTTPLSVVDARGTAGGWRVTVTSQAFQTAGGAGQPIAATVILAGVSARCGQSSSCTAPTNSVHYPVLLSGGQSGSGTVPLFSAGAGTGMGTVLLTPELRVELPAGIDPGTYTSELRFAVTTGP